MTLLRHALNALAILLAITLAAALPARAFETRATGAMVIDYDTGVVLLERNADTPLPPASMSKLMTLMMVFEALEAGRLTLDQQLPVSQAAMAYGGSSMFLDTRDRVSVEDLIRGIVVMSGNDATVVVAEALAGTDSEFALRMTERARELGMLNSTFRNSNGWPHPEQRMSPRDLVFLARRLIKEFPQYYPYFAETEFAFDNRAPDNRFNRNPLLRMNIGADGLKTGHTAEAGYGLVGSAVRDGRRVVFMITGLENDAQRAQEAERIVSWAFSEFVTRTFFPAETEIARASLWLGATETVGLALPEEVRLVVPYRAADDVVGFVTYQGPLAVSDENRRGIARGERIATLEVIVPDWGRFEFPLLATEDVAPAGFVRRYRAAFGHLSRQLLAAF